MRQTISLKGTFMIKELITNTDILSTPCQAATPEDVADAQDLVDTLASLEDAACLAANQIGVTKKIVAYKDPEDNIHVIYNPKLQQGLHASKMEEECLTLEGVVSKVKRFGWIKISWEEPKDGTMISHKQEFTGWYAEIIQHMIDHCNGKLV